MIRPPVAAEQPPLAGVVNAGQLTAARDCFHAGVQPVEEVPTVLLFGVNRPVIEEPAGLGGVWEIEQQRQQQQRGSRCEVGRAIRP